MWNVENTAVNEIAAAGAPARLNPPVSLPVAAPFESRRANPGSRRARPTAAAAVAVEAPPSLRRLHELASQPEQERMVPTFQMRRRSDVRIVIGKLVLPVAVLVSIGIVVGAYVAFGGDRGASRALAGAVAAAPVEIAVPVAAPGVGSPPIVSPAPPATPPPATAPVLVDVRIESTPAGATVMLVDRGRTQLVGDTPVDAAVDPSRAYDLVFRRGDGPPRVEHLDPATTRRVAVDLEPPAPAPAPRQKSRSGRR